MNYEDILNFFKINQKFLSEEEYLTINNIISKMRYNEENEKIKNEENEESEKIKNEESEKIKNEESEKIKNEGNEAFKKEEYLKAFDLYTKAIKLNPQNPYLYSNRAIVCAKLNKEQNGIDDCLKGLELDPSLIKLYIRLALFYELKDKKLALKYVKEGLIYEPKNTYLLEFLNKLENKNEENIIKNEEDNNNNEKNENDKKMDFKNIINNPNFKNMVDNFLKDKSQDDISKMVNDLLGNFNK